MLSLNAINVQFGHNHVLRNLSCSVDAGDFVTIVGTNGAGKSTFFETIAGRVLPNSGSILLDGIDITKRTEQERAGLITRIFQNTRLNSVGSFTVAQNLAMAYYSRRSARLVNGMNTLSRAKAQEIVCDLGLDPKVIDRKMNQLSGGQRQLIAFAMSTQLIPKVLLLDEPTAALDPQAATKLLSHAAHFIKKHRVTTMLITHDPHIALSMGNKVWVLENGVINRQYNEQEKQTLNPEQLIGHIDYAAIKS